MYITTTFGEINDKFCWEEFCDLKGYDYWIMNEGLADAEEEVSLTLEECQKIGFSINLNKVDVA